MCMDFANSVFDIVICAVMPRRILNKYEQRQTVVGTENDKSDLGALSDVSSVDSNEKVQVYQVGRRQR